MRVSFIKANFKEGMDSYIFEDSVELLVNILPTAIVKDIQKDRNIFPESWIWDYIASIK